MQNITFWTITSLKTIYSKQLNNLTSNILMALSSTTCYLKCVQNPQKKINLPHQKLVIIGRNEETGITDLHVSRSHLECTADLNTGKVLIKTIGKSHSGCNGYALMQGETYSLKHGDRIEVKLGSHEFDIIFESMDSDSPQAKKPRLEESQPENKSKQKWEEIDDKELLIFTPENCQAQSSIASFDLDGTIIKTKSGARFPKDSDDWIINFSNIPKKLKTLHENNHKIVFFTNQSGIGKDSSKIKGYKGKVEAIVNKLALPIQVFIATGKSIYRKPAPGMWNVLRDVKNENIDIDINSSFYVGDAAGREKNWAPKKNKDHSIGDRLFALNIGLKFYTPEEYFQKGHSVKYIMPEFDPRNIPLENYPQLTTTSQEVIVMVGGQGSGKTYYCEKYLIPKGYIHISRDKLGSWQKCVKMLEECLRKQQSVVIDNTNPDKESRQRYVEVAKKNGISCRCFTMNTSHKHGKHNNRFRELTDKSHAAVGDIILNSYKSAYQEPDLEEGFTEIVKVPFVPKFDNPDHEKLYKMFLLDN